MQENLIPREGCNFTFQLRESPGLEYSEILASLKKLVQRIPLSPPRKQVSLPHPPTEHCSGGLAPYVLWKRSVEASLSLLASGISRLSQRQRWLSWTQFFAPSILYISFPFWTGGEEITNIFKLHWEMVSSLQRIFFFKFVLIQKRPISDLSLKGHQPTSNPNSFSSECWVDRHRITHANCAWIMGNVKLMILEPVVGGAEG